MERRRRRQHSFSLVIYLNPLCMDGSMHFTREYHLFITVVSQLSHFGGFAAVKLYKYECADCARRENNLAVFGQGPEIMEPKYINKWINSDPQFKMVYVWASVLWAFVVFCFNVVVSAQRRGGGFILQFWFTYTKCTQMKGTKVFCFLFLFFLAAEKQQRGVKEERRGFK